MNTSIKIKQIVVILGCCLFSACEDFLEVDAPSHKIVSETVFENDETAMSAMAGLYNQLSTVSFSSGGTESVTLVGGLSSDVLSPIRSTNLPYMQFEQHELLPENFRNYNLWASAYNIIYMSNSILEGLSNSGNITEEVRIKLEGETNFVRAFTYFYLVNLYGDVPIILTTNYQENALAERASKEAVWQQIITDLQKSIDLLQEVDITIERTRVNRYTAISLMARVQLYLQNWSEAENLSSEVIDQIGNYEILEDLNHVFLANSREAIWQLSPIGRGSVLTNTYEGSTFIIDPFLSFLSHIKLNNDFLSSFSENDKRLENWIGFDAGTENYFSYKYKVRNSTEDITEYSMVLRLAEQYLIRAEARARMDDLSGAISDLDLIRTRAGLESLANFNSEISIEALLEIILEERKRELFTEWGHRWLDLKRTEMTSEVFGNNLLWQNTDILYPIPEADRIKNPSLTQNDGY